MSVKDSWISEALVITALLGAIAFSCSPGFAQSFADQTATLAPGLAGGKVAWGDYNNDGYVDLLSGGIVWRNNGGTSFTNINAPLGGDGLWGDFNNDGFLDLFGYSNKSLLQNNGGAGFGNVTSKIPAFGTHQSRGAAWADLNNDGYLDLYVGGYEVWDPSVTYPDKILTYNKLTQQFNATWSETAYRARGVTVADFDRDGDQDVYVSNYRLQPNRLWQNNGTGVMTDVAAARGVAGDGDLGAWGHTIGSSWGDFDNDGYLDLFVGNFSHPESYQDRPQFLRNPGAAGGAFQLKNTLDGADWQESYASPALGDYDNDGDLDLFFTTVYGGDYPRLYRNDGNWNFTNVTAQEGLGGIGSTYQAAWADFDNDGDLDLVSDGKVFVNNESQTGTNHWLKVKLIGDGVNVNTAAIGAEVRIFTGAVFLTRQVEGGTGEGNQNDLTMHFGLGSYPGPVYMQIAWPDGTTQNVTGIAVDDLAVIELTPSEPAAVHYIFNEVAAGQWEVSAEVTGEGTSGLSAYSVWVKNTDPEDVSFTENALFDYATFRGFLPPNLVQGDVGGDFNVGNYQSAGDYGITGVGMVPISLTDVDLDVPALLGILSTPAGLGEDDFAALSAGLLNATNDGYLIDMIVTYEVDPLVWLLGDANLDTVVSADDYASVQANFGNTGAAGGGLLGDANHDGLVSADDYASVQANFGNTSGGMPPVPEPASLMAMLAGLSLLMLRRRRVG